MGTKAPSRTCLLRNGGYHCDRLARARILTAVCTCVLAGSIGVAAQSAPATAYPPPPGAHSPTAKLQLRGVQKFGEVTRTLYRGAQPTKEGFANLRKLGINIVVDLRGNRSSERRIVNALGMTYVPLPWRCYSPHDEHFARFLTLLRENPDKKVFVHCRVGDDRTGMDIAAYRMAEQGWTADEARKEMTVFGVNWFHNAICPRLGSYEKHFPERWQTSPAFRDLRSRTHPVEPKR